MTDTARVAHSVSEDTDIELAIALGLSVRASCGETFVPKYNGTEAAQFPDCRSCHPRAARRGAHKTPVAVRQSFPHYVYRCYDARDRLLYVGCTYNPPARLRQHRAEKAQWVDALVKTRIIVFPNRRKALDMERLAIETEHPIYNRQFSLVNRRPA